MRAIDILPYEIKEKGEFLIVGAGEPDIDTQKLIDRNECIKLIGETPYEKMSNIYNRTDVVACCSRSEGLSSVIIESCMYKRFSIVSDAAGIVDYLDDEGNCLVFETEKITDLRNKILWIFENTKKAKGMGEKSFDVYKKNFDTNVFEKNVESIFG